MMLMKCNGWKPRTTGGFSLVFAVALTTLMLFGGIAYLKWTTSTGMQSHRQTAAVQAYYTAQAAIIEYPMEHLKRTKRSDLAFPAVIAFNDGHIDNMGRFENA